MEVEGLDLLGLLEGPTPLPDDLDDLFPEELMQYLSASEDSQPSVSYAATAQAQPAPLAAVAATAPSTIAEPTPSTSSSRAEGQASPIPITAPPSPPATVDAAAVAAAAATPMLAPVQFQTVGAIPRLVTTAAAQQMWTAMLHAAYCTGPSPACISDAAAVNSTQPAGTSRQGSHECSADSSDTDHDDLEMVDSKGKAAGSKRKAPEVDWRQIEDPAERRRQRRLAKNRVTAARSRERKKVMWSELEDKLKSMENENLQLRAMLEQFARENASLKTQLLTMTRAGVASSAAGGAQAAPCHLARAAGKTMDPAGGLLAPAW